MAAYRQVFDSRHLQADCQEPGSAPEPYAEAIEYGLPVPFTVRSFLHDKNSNFVTYRQVATSLA